ncbi:ATP-binding protein [bacterium]|nr:ATP-binding protein [bacterium]
MKELVVISGKGGTGKTSLVASFAALAGRVVLADCDVDAADLHLVLDPENIKQEDFSGGGRAEVIPEKCSACGKCLEVCRFDAVSFDGPRTSQAERTFRVDPISCEGCGVCAYYCPEKAIRFEPVKNGEWFISHTRFGTLVHARLGIAEENSGKLVSLIRKEAKRIAQEQQQDLILIDGSPGIGCPVIASLTGAQQVLIVTEPTQSGLHDLKRVFELTRHFQSQTYVCVNKWDLNPGMTKEIQDFCNANQGIWAGRIRYDKAVVKAQLARRTLPEITSAGIVEDIQGVWKIMKEQMQ